MSDTPKWIVFCDVHAMSVARDFSKHVGAFLAVNPVYSQNVTVRDFAFKFFQFFLRHLDVEKSEFSTAASEFQETVSTLPNEIREVEIAAPRDASFGTWSKMSGSSNCRLDASDEETIVDEMEFSSPSNQRFGRKLRENVSQDTIKAARQQGTRNTSKQGTSGSTHSYNTRYPQRKCVASRENEENKLSDDSKNREFYVSKYVRIQPKPAGFIDCHVDVMPWRCKVCGKGFKGKRHILERHMLCHTDERPYKCSVCGHTLRSSAQMKEHSRYHTEERPFWCSVCSESFNRKSTLMRHFLRHSSDFMCHLCGVGYRKEISLKKHMVSHTDGKPAKRNRWNKNIGENGIPSDRLSIGVRKSQPIPAHTRERWYKCFACRKEFVTCSRLIEHMYEHTRENPFQCKMCDMKFDVLRDIKKHVRQHTDHDYNVSGIPHLAVDFNSELLQRRCKIPHKSTSLEVVGVTVRTSESKKKKVPTATLR